MASLPALLWRTTLQVWVTLAHNWPYLVAGVLMAAVARVYLDQQKVAAFLRRNQGQGVLAATAAGVATPLCSCGTTAVILGMMANEMPWAPIVAFMVASPLTSPEELLYSGGLFGWKFAWTFFGASIVLGLMGGLFAYLLERAGLLSGQTRMAEAKSECFATEAKSECCAAAAPVELLQLAPALKVKQKPRWQFVLPEALATTKQLLPRFLGFAFIGYFLNGLIPETLVARLFGSGHTYGVPLAATLGLPLYLNTESSLPLLKALMSNGMSPGAGLAFLITGAGTSVGAIAGALTIARWRVIGVVVATLWVGAILFGWGYNAALGAGLL